MWGQLWFVGSSWRDCVTLPNMGMPTANANGLYCWPEPSPLHYRILLAMSKTCVPALPNSVGNSLPIMDLPKPVSQHYRILLATHCRLWTYQQLYTRTFSVTLFGKLTTNLGGVPLYEINLSKRWKLRREKFKRRVYQNWPQLTLRPIMKKI